MLISSFTLLLFLLSINSSAQLCSNEEAAALLHFKTSFSIHQNYDCGRPQTESWKEGVDCCSWDGVGCDNLTGRVIDLDLRCSKLSGSFPSNSSLFLLKNLQSLYLSDNDFKGSKIPSEIGQFSSLKFLYLLDSGFSGLVPGEISHLSKLESLILDDNGGLILETSTLRNLVQNLSQATELSLYNISGMSSVNPCLFTNLSTSLTTLELTDLRGGNFPSNIFELPNLQSLGLSGSLSEVVGNQKLLTVDLTSSNWSSSLQGLTLDNVHSSGGLPESIGDLKSLRDLRVHGCDFEGSVIPSSIFNLVNLTDLDLSYNNLSGDLDLGMLSNLQNLETLALSDSKLSLITSINANFTLPKLFHVDLSLCNLSQFPSFIRDSTNLLFLDLSSNGIQGDILRWMWDIGKDTLTYLNLSFNVMTADLKPLPWKVMQTLDLRSNKFQGALPIPPDGTYFFQVSNNHFDGQISSEICKVDTFEILDLSHNNFSGKVPSCLFHKSILRVLNLQANKFHGAIPSTFTKGCELQNLNLHENRMEGPLPRSLVNCDKLEVLDVGNNIINDTFPNWLESLNELQVLVLRSNFFHGYVSSNAKTNSSFLKLRILDLFNNDLGGPLPVQYIKNLKAMVDTREDRNSSQYMEDIMMAYNYHFSVVVTMKGLTVDLEKILTIFTSIDLSKNNFAGEILDDIGKLSSLKGLNFSYNNLGGHIPHSIGNLTNLEWLDLSSNEFGKIPEEPASLNQLSTLNLSNNQLMGHIPQGRHFDTFDNGSFRGNSGLCGLPLSKVCVGNGRIDDQPPTSFQEENEFWELDWRVVALGFGCGTTFGLLMGYFMFLTGKPKWFASTFDLYPYLRGMRKDRARRRIQRRNQ